MATALETLGEKARELPPGSFRQNVLLAAKRFKSSWVELGKLLVKVRDEALFTEWGHDSFETYCFKELRIRKQTALKLTRSFSFLDKHEPKAMETPDIVETAPAFEVVEVLADAEERGQLSSQEYKSIRDSIWNPEKPVSELRRELVDRFPKPESASGPDNFSLKRLTGLANKLAQEMGANKKVPRAMVDRAKALVSDLEELAAGNQVDG